MLKRLSPNNNFTPQNADKSTLSFQAVCRTCMSKYLDSHDFQAFCWGVISRLPVVERMQPTKFSRTRKVVESVSDLSMVSVCEMLRSPRLGKTKRSYSPQYFPTTSWWVLTTCPGCLRELLVVQVVANGDPRSNLDRHATNRCFFDAFLCLYTLLFLAQEECLVWERPQKRSPKGRSRCAYRGRKPTPHFEHPHAGAVCNLAVSFTCDERLIKIPFSRDKRELVSTKIQSLPLPRHFQCFAPPAHRLLTVRRGRNII